MRPRRRSACDVLKGAFPRSTHDDPVHFLETFFK